MNRDLLDSNEGQHKVTWIKVTRDKAEDQVAQMCVTQDKPQKLIVKIHTTLMHGKSKKFSRLASLEVN